MLKFKSIFEKLFWNNAAILILVFVSVSVSMSVFINKYSIDEQFDLLSDVKNMLEYDTARMQLESDSSDARSIQAYKRSLMSWSSFADADITISNTDGTVFTSTASIKSVPDEYISELKKNGRLVVRDNFGGHYEDNMLIVGMPIEYSGNTIGAVYFSKAYPLLYSNILELTMMFIASSAFSVIVAFFIVYNQAKSISSPIKQINKAALDIAAGNFDKRVSVTSDDEIGQLASTFNYMADSIEKLDDMRSRFISDVSHELRTPMTSISGFVQGIIDGTIPEEKRDEYLQIVLDESTRLGRLVTDMLEMSKLSSGEYKLDMTEFDITEIIRLSIIQLENRISEKSLDLDVNFESDSIKVLADKDSIKRVVINLLDNAIKFSYPNTTIGISVWVKDSQVFTSIGNFGDGIDSKDLASIFDRFYKTDRSRTNDKGGAGLGLSFVKKILVHHRQGVWVESNYAKEGSNVKYTKFTFTLEKA